MARTKGLLPLSGNFEPQVAGPFDARSRVETKADLLLLATWQSKDGNPYTYVGMVVTVYADATEENNGIYRLKAADYTQANNWEKAGAGDTVDLDAINTQLATANEAETATDTTVLYVIGKAKISALKLYNYIKAKLDLVYAAINHNHNLADLSEKSYNSLSDKPTIPSIAGLMKEVDYTGETGLQQVNYAKHSEESELAINSYSAKQDGLGREIHTTYALKDSGITPPETETITLTNASPVYTVTNATAPALIVLNNATIGGEIYLSGELGTDKSITIQIFGNDTLVSSHSGSNTYQDEDTVFASFEVATASWFVTDTETTIIPDYSDMIVDTMLVNPTITPKPGYIYVSGAVFTINTLVFIKSTSTPTQIGIYKVFSTSSGGSNMYLIAAGTALHTVRVKDGDVWYSQYDGKNAASLVFDNTKKRVDALFAGSINAAAVDVSTWQSGEERPIGAMKDPTTGQAVFAPNIEVVDVYSISAAYKAALETGSNWIVGGLPQPFWVSGWGLQGMRHQNNNYMYECIEDNKWIRYPLIAILDIYAVPGTEVTKLTTAGNWTGVNYTGAALVGCYKGMRHVSTTHVYEFYDDNTPCRTARI